MMDKIYKKLSSYLSKNQNINKDDEELYEYAAKVAVHGIINIFVTILIGIFVGMLKECICLYSTFFILRKFVGGWHFNKYSYCLISSIILMVLALFFIRFISDYFNLKLFLVTLICSSFFIVCLAPIDNKNKQLSFKEKKIYKTLSTIITLIVLFSIKVCLHNELFSLAYSMGLAIILTTVFLVAGKVRRFFELNRT